MVPSLEITRVEDEADTARAGELSMVTSTVRRRTRRRLPSLDIAASPLFQTPSQTKTRTSGSSPFTTPDTVKTRQSRSVLGEDDKELSAAIEEVTSPKYLEKLHTRFGAAARERERQIAREIERKGEAERETEEVFSDIDKRLQTHLKITQV